MADKTEKPIQFQPNCEICAPPIIESAAEPPCCPPLSASLNVPTPLLGFGLVGVLLLAKQTRLLRRVR